MLNSWDEIIVNLSTIEVIITGAFLVLSTLLGAFIANRLNDRKLNSIINRKIGEVNNTTLSGQHDNLLEQNKVLSNDNKKLFTQMNYQVKSTSDKLQSDVRGIDTFLKIKEEREQNRFSSLSDSQKKIDSQIEGIRATFTELHRLQSENKALQKRVYDLENQLEKHMNKQREYNDLER